MNNDKAPASVGGCAGECGGCKGECTEMPPNVASALFAIVLVCGTGFVSGVILGWWIWG